MAKAKSEAGGALDRSPSHLLHRALQRALDLYGEIGGPDGVTQRQYAVLAAVAADEGLTQTGLVKATGIDRSTLADLVARMITKKLVERERSSVDARANAVRLTEFGRAALADAAPKAQAADEALLKLLAPGKRSGFLSALAAVAEGGRRKADAEAKAKDKDKRARKAEKKVAKKEKKKAKKAARPEAEPVAA
jgi:MarR family transcriptional regulator, temperature-dependent positive regulator of motility